MPDKSPDAFRTISEVADWLGVQPHVLRFWESKFSQVRPVKRAGGRRYYRPNDMLLLGGIRKLLHEDGLTIKGAQKVLREEGMSYVARMSQPLDAESAALSDLDDGDAHALTGDRDIAPEPAEEEPGKVLSFSGPKQDAPKVTPDGGASDSEPADAEAPAPQRPDLSGAPAPKDDADDGAAHVEQRAEQTRDEPEPARQPDPAEEEPASEDVPIPSFRRSSSLRKPPEREASQPETSQAAPSDRLPSFLQKPQPPRETPPASAADRNAATDQGSEPPATAKTPEPQPPAAPKPRIVDIPDPDESKIDVRPGALGACYAARRLTPDQRAEILPLVSQLAALRDRMAASRGR